VKPKDNFDGFSSKNYGSQSPLGGPGPSAFNQSIEEDLELILQHRDEIQVKTIRKALVRSGSQEEFASPRTAHHHLSKLEFDNLTF